MKVKKPLLKPSKMQTQKKNFPSAGKFDRNGSTYKHEIFLSNGIVLTGYSKSLYYPEKQDKIVLLQDIILRLYHNGYFNKSDKIIFYELDLFSKDKLEIFTLTPTTYTFGSLEKFVLNDRINAFITKFYAHMKVNRVTDNIKNKGVSKTEEELFCIKQKRFSDFPTLIEFVNKCFKNGHNKDVVMHFYRQYTDKWLANSY